MYRFFFTTAERALAWLGFHGLRWRRCRFCLVARLLLAALDLVCWNNCAHTLLLTGLLLGILPVLLADLVVLPLCWPIQPHLASHASNSALFLVRDVARRLHTVELCFSHVGAGVRAGPVTFNRAAHHQWGRSLSWIFAGQCILLQGTLLEQSTSHPADGVF